VCEGKLEEAVSKDGVDTENLSGERREARVPQEKKSREAELK
jgi:hypothetical protein